MGYKFPTESVRTSVEEDSPDAKEPDVMARANLEPWLILPGYSQNSLIKNCLKFSITNLKKTIFAIHIRIIYLGPIKAKT